MSGEIRGILAGFRVGIRTNPFIPASSGMNIAQGSLEECGKEVKYLSDTIDERGESCREAKELLFACEETVMLYIGEVHGGHSSIGTNIAQNNETGCKNFLRGYYNWLSHKFYVEAKTMKPEMPSVPDIPSLPPLKMPGTGIAKDIKRSAQVTGIVLIGFILLIVYMLTGRGKKGVTVVT